MQYSFSVYRGVLFGYEINRITGRLGYALRQNDFIVVDTTPDVLDVGNIVTYDGSGGLSVARIREKNDNRFFVNHPQDYQTIIPRTSIHGKTIYIWFSWGTDNNIRWERFPRFIY